MSKRLLLEKIKKLIHDWAAQYPKVELAYVEVYHSGIADNIHVIVVASQGFENWESTDRENDLYWFLRKALGDEYIVKIYVLRTMTEEEYDRYEVVRE
ncbi:MAG: hypothetical protein AAB354_06460 [candidate division KSB1 bacterium]